MRKYVFGLLLLPSLLLSQITAPVVSAAGGERIVFTVIKGNNRLGLGAISPDGRERYGLTDEDDFAPEFSPNGRNLAYVHTSDDGVYLFVSGARGQDPRPLARLRPRGSVSCGDSFDWAPDSLRLAIATRSEEGDEGCDLQIVDLRGRLTSVTDSDEDDAAPDWSPDATSIAFERRATAADPSDIYVVSVTGGEPTRLTEDESDDIAPAWSPEGDRVAFTTDRDDCCGSELGASNLEIYVMDREGVEETRVTTNEINDHQPTWSPYGEWLVYWTSALCDGFACGEHADIWKVRPDGTEPTRLTWTRADAESAPVWSPTGRWIAYAVRWGRGHHDLAKVNASGTRSVRLTRTRQIEELHPDWT